MDELRGITAFVRTAETLSFTAAGRLLGISASGVSNAVSRLEAQVEVRLLNRSTRSVSLTPEGALFFERCRPSLQKLQEARDTLVEGKFGPRGQLRVNMPHALGRMHIVPRLPEFTARHPAVTFLVGLDNRMVDPIESGWDVLVRSVAPTDSTLIARKLGVARMVTCAAPAYLGRNGTPERVEDLHQHNCLQLLRHQTGRIREWGFLVDAQPRTFAFSGTYTSDSNEALIAAAVAGAGIIQVHSYHLDELLRINALVPLLEGFQGSGSPLWAIYPRTRQLSPKLRAFVDFLVEVLPGVLK